jgi:tRNA nucleotidyltransferase/poly(A) polymerase
MNFSSIPHLCLIYSSFNPHLFPLFMPAISADPVVSRNFAREVVRRLRAAGHEALWAGGCVRDELLGRVPADYDVATSAQPAAVRLLFGQRRTLAVGAAFGVITVVGPRPAGHVEVTTFRTDAAYTDGRHPAGVTLSTPQEDAQRRDFTINGLFLDPESGRVDDYVGGQADLASGVVRAIGTPTLRFGEDHLRMLRAVRFAAAFGFLLDEGTRSAIVRMAPLVRSVSPERIAAELRTMLSRPGRQRALELLAETGLAQVVFPEWSPLGQGAKGDREGQGDDPATTGAWLEGARMVGALEEPGLPAALAMLSLETGAETVSQIATRLRLSNRELNTATWLYAALQALGGEPARVVPAERPWSQVQPWLAHPDAPLLADCLRARATHGAGSPATAAWVCAQLTRPREQLDPPPLLGGADLLGAGLPAGRAVGQLLAKIRTLQLDGGLHSREEAIEWAIQQASSNGS